MSSKPFLSRNSTRVYLESYLLVLGIIFVTPLILELFLGRNPVIMGANILFFEFNLFLSLVLLVYTYFTRDENRNWKLFVVYFVLCLLFLVLSMFVLGGSLYFGFL
ncbi:MAG: hypothetical protein IJI98_06270 [Methanosphaera sp.]|nr:hypothetical protein [Methanosphaera sp.]